MARVSPLRLPCWLRVGALLLALSASWVLMSQALADTWLSCGRASMSVCSSRSASP